MSPWMRWMSLVSPLRYYIDFTLGVVLKGSSLKLVLGDVVGILLLGSSLFVFSLLWFERSRRTTKM